MTHVRNNCVLYRHSICGNIRQHVTAIYMWQYSPTTLKVQIFAGTNFRDFANFLAVRENKSPRNRTFRVFREISLKKQLNMASN